jgi:site-specific recombinase XerD
MIFDTDDDIEIADRDDEHGDEFDDVGDDGFDDDGDDEPLAGLRRLGLAVLHRPTTIAAAGVVGGVERSDVARLDQAADELERRSLSANTLRAYSAAWQSWEAFLYATIGQSDPYAGVTADVRRYVAAMATQQLTMSTIRLRLAAIRWAYRQNGLESPTASAAVECTVAGAARELGTDQHQAPPLRLEHLEKLLIGAATVLRKPNDDVVVRRDQALLATLYWSAGRISEILGLNTTSVAVQGDPNVGGVGE